MARDEETGPDPLTPEDRREIYGERQKGELRRFLKPTLWGLLAVFAVVFVVSNFDEVSVSFIAFQVETRLVWVLIFSVLLGALLDEAFRFWRRRGTRRSEETTGS
jgi:uncharacterized integral membrane protein